MVPYRFCNGPDDLIEKRMRWPANAKGEFKQVPQADQLNQNGASRKQLIHYGQIGKNRRFQQYDYGNVTNKKLYGSMKPPEIKVQNIRKVPIVLYTGTSDIISTLEDSKWIQKWVPTVKRTNVIQKFDHQKMQLVDLRCG